MRMGSRCRAEPTLSVPSWPSWSSSTPRFSSLTSSRMRFGPFGHQGAVGRQGVALAVPVHELDPQLLFERLDAAAQRRLGEEEGFGGLAEGLMLGLREPGGAAGSGSCTTFW